MSERGRTSAAELRDAFDRGFSESPPAASPGFDGFLVVRLGTDAYLLALAELAGLLVDRRIVALPTRAPHLLGVAGVRGALTPIYDLAAMLGYPPVGAAARWIALTRSRERLGLAFDRFGGHIRTPRDGAPRAPDATLRSRVRDAVRIDSTLYRIVDTLVVVGEIEDAARGGARMEE